MKYFKTTSIVLISFGIAMALITWLGWNYGGFDIPFLYFLSALLVIVGISRYADADKPATERRIGLKIFGFLLALFGLGLAILGALGNVFYLLIGILSLVGGVIIFSNPYLIRPKS